MAFIGSYSHESFKPCPIESKQTELNKGVILNGTESVISGPDETEFVKAFEIAKKAISMVGLFRTPPTPDVYSMWYRFAEGSDDHLSARLDYHVNELKSLDKPQLESILDELAPKPSETTLDICSSLTHEAHKLQEVTSAQLAASKQFGNSLAQASTSLDRNDSFEVMRHYLSQIVAGHDTLNMKLEETELKLGETLSKVEALKDQLSHMQQELMQDSLCGVGNRSYFESLMRQALNDDLDDSTYVFLLLIDLDEFKLVNDEYGHQCGDALLRYVAKELERLTTQNCVARIGGDEFAIVLRNHSEHFGKEIANGIVESIATKQLAVDSDGPPLHRVTMSVGVAMLRDGDTRESWFNRADKLLYHAKGSGRNCAKSERLMSVTSPSAITT